VFRTIVSLNSINRLGFVAETCYVSCEVRTEFVYSTYKIKGSCIPPLWSSG
jgi:hypothetical protein